jgi:hypothetical protein
MNLLRGLQRGNFCWTALGASFSLIREPMGKRLKKKKKKIEIGEVKRTLTVIRALLLLMIRILLTGHKAFETR